MNDVTTHNTKRKLRIGPLRNSALLSAGMRALEHSSPSEPDRPIVTDPQAEFLAGDIGTNLARQLEDEFPTLRHALLCRQRFVDEWVTAKIREGSRTVFGLATGVECRFSRLPIVAETGARIFEIDSKPMLLLKLHRLKALLQETPQNTVFMECRSVHRLPIKTLKRMRGLGTRPAVFILEGLLSVFEPPQVESLLTDVSGVRVARRSIALDYLDERHSAKTDSNGFLKAYAGGIPRFFMSQDRIRRALERLGYRKIHDRSLTEITGYYRSPIDELSSIRVVTAEATSGN